MSIVSPVIWYIGESDTSGYHGWQAACRIAKDLGCDVKTVESATALTHLNQKRGVEAVSLARFNQQWQGLFDGPEPAAIQIRLLPSLDMIKACSYWLALIKANCSNVKVILDLDRQCDAIDCDCQQQVALLTALKETVLPYADLIVTDVTQGAALLGLPLNALSSKEPFSKGGSFDTKGACEEALEESVTEWLAHLTPFFADHLEPSRVAWLIKGPRHQGASVTDWLIEHDTTTGFVTDRLASEDGQGKGDVLSAALTAFLAHEYDRLDAVTMAKAYLSEALKEQGKADHNCPQLGTPSWPLQITNLPRIHSHDNQSNRPSVAASFASISPDDMGLYPVVDSIAWLELVLKQGVTIAQLRIKDPKDNALDNKIEQAVALGKKYGACIFINDYWQQAIQFGAYGVHLGQGDLEVADLKKIQGAGLRLGISTHGYYEIARAQAIRPSYIALGHIFPTQTKTMPSQPQGLARLSHYVNLLKGVFPTVAIGGINARRLPSVAQTGVDSVALVTAITQAAAPELATQSLITAFQQHRRQ